MSGSGNDAPAAFLPWLVGRIEQWWGEELTTVLAARIAAAPAEHLVAFSETIAYEYGVVDIDVVMTGGMLRPLVAPANLWDPTTGAARRATAASIPMALRLLLYTHEVAIEVDDLLLLQNFDRGTDVTHEARRRLATVLRQLAGIRALVLKHLIHATVAAKNVSRSRHPSRMGPFTSVDHPALIQLARDIAQIPDDVELRDWDVTEILYAHFGMLHLACDFARDRYATPLACSHAEEQVLTYLLGHEAGDRRHSLVSSLARLPVPDFGHDADLLVKIREDHEAFDSWRHTLGSALESIRELPDTTDMHTAADIVHSELTSATADLRRAVHKSPLLGSAQGTARRLSFGAIGAGTTYELTGNAVAAFAALGATQVAESAYNYVTALRQRRPDKLVLDVVASFTATADD